MVHGIQWQAESFMGGPAERNALEFSGIGPVLADAGIRFAASGGWWLSVTGLTVVAVLVAVVFHRSAWRQMGRAGIACALLKILGIVLLALCLLQPQWVSERASPGENIVAVLVDRGAGLSVGIPPAAEDVTAALEQGRQPAGWLEALAGQFRLRGFAFDDQVREIPLLESGSDVPPLEFDGPSSALGMALSSVTRRYAGRPVAAVLVLTDGNATDLDAGESLQRLMGEGAGMPPVYPVLPRERPAFPDVSVDLAGIGQTAFEDAPVTIRARVTVSGIGDQPFAAQVRLVEPESGEVLAEERIAFPSGTVGGAASDVVELRFRPERSGVTFYRLECEGAAEEIVTQNNSRWVMVDRGAGPYRILYVSGRPNWEFKFLNRAMDEDDQTALVGLVRVARREPKFEWRGRSGESANPLFRGFGEDAAEQAEYDQPVLVRLNTEDEKELRDGFPSAREELFRYHAIVIDDLEAEFFTPDQLSLIRDFVSVRGGGFLMLGGQESLELGGYAETPVADVLPAAVTGEPGNALVDFAAGLRIELTRDGMLEPWARLRDSADAERERLADMPGFMAANLLGRQKPGAIVLATVGGDAPAIVAQPFGRGKALAVTLADLWRWGMRDPAQRTDLERAWRQTMRWLVTDVPSRVECSVDQASSSGTGTVGLVARVRDAEYEFDPESDVRITITAPDQSEVVSGGEPSTDRAGVFTAAFRSRLSGGYLAAAEATSFDGEWIGRGETGWVHDPEAQEFARLGINRPLAEELARKTGGRVLSIGDLDEFARSLPESSVPVVETRAIDLWHVPVVFLLGLLCLVGEWGLRRSNGFA